MRVVVLGDLHFDYWKKAGKDPLGHRADNLLSGADALILNGDISNNGVESVNGGAKLCHGAAQNWASFGSGVTGRRQRRPVIRAPHVAGG